MFFYTVLKPISTTSGLWSTGNTRKYHQFDVYIYQCVLALFNPGRHIPTWLNDWSLLSHFQFYLSIWLENAITWPLREHNKFYLVLFREIQKSNSKHSCVAPVVVWHSHFFDAWDWTQHQQLSQKIISNVGHSPKNVWKFSKPPSPPPPPKKKKKKKIP